MSLSITEVTARFETICGDPYGPAREAAGRGTKVAGYMCTYVPEEILHAAGYLPLRIFGWSDGTQRADGLLQTYACSLARGALDAGLSGKLDFLNVMIFAHTCDTIQNLTDIWQRNVPGMRHRVLSAPVSTSGEAAVTFFRDELGRLRRFLEEGQGPVSDAAIEESITLYERHRAAMRRLYELRRNDPLCLTGKEMLSVVLASFLMRKEDHLPLLHDLIKALEHPGVRAVSRNPGPKTQNPIRVFVIGSVCQSAEYMRAIEEAGCVVVDDDLCTGSRAFAVQRVSGADPIDALARMYLERVPCPAKHRPGYDMGTDILAQARAARAGGVIFLLTKFCDPWAFDYPSVREALEAASIPSLLVEIEQDLSPSAHFSTRIGAFAEMLASRSGFSELVKK